MKKRSKRKESRMSFSLVQFFTIGIFVLLTSFLLFKCSDSAADKPVVAEKEEVKNEVFNNDDSLKKTSPQKEITDQPVLKNKIENSSNSGSFLSRSIKWFWQNTIRLILVVVIIFLIYQVIVIRAENEKIKFELRRIKKNLNSVPGQLHFGEKILRKPEFEEFVTKFEERLSVLESKNIKINPTEIPETSILVNPEPQEKQNELIFFPAPNSEGYFKVNQGSKRFVSGQYIFRFEYSTENPAEAKYTVVNDTDSMKYAINYSDAILRTACEIENLMYANPSKIINIIPGVVKKQDEKWLITQKSVIRYE